MSQYKVVIKEEAQNDLKYLSLNEPKAFKKAIVLISELYEHPHTGTGKPERLKGGDGTLWESSDFKKAQISLRNSRSHCLH